jgi:hypothetical protein
MNTSRIKIGSRAPAPMRIVLSIADVRQEVTVSTQAARVSTDSIDNLDAVALDRQALDNLPIFDQDYIGAISRFLDAGAVGTGGVTLIVDGLEATRAGVSASAIQEVKINQNPYSAEYSRPGRGRRDYHQARLSGIPRYVQFSVSRLPSERPRTLGDYPTPGAAPNLRGQSDRACIADQNDFLPDIRKS